jgi:hypothetical protein
VVVWSDQQTGFAGSVSARGGPGGRGGFIEVSAKGQLNYSGNADAGATHGQAGTLLLDPKNLVISAAPVGVLPQFDLTDPHPTAGGDFGDSITVLRNGNVVVTNPDDDFGGPNAGAVYLFDGVTGALISSLVGGANDQVVSFGVGTLSSGNYVIRIPQWNANRGAVTWGSSTVGVSGVVSEANSLVGSNPGDQVGTDQFGLGSFSFLDNGNYVVRSPFWNGYRGAVTWASGTAGVRGVVSEANSLVGSNPGDQVGSNYLTLLSNGNYVVPSPLWDGNRGAATWGSGTGGVRGVVSEANSLVGSSPGDQVGATPITVLSSGNYVIRSPQWNANRGAVTWGSGTAGVRGVVSETNSVVGSTPGDQVGSLAITTLSSGHYLFRSPLWDGNRGAVTWGSGTAGVRGVLSEANSLVGNNPADQVGSGDITTLSNGNYMVLSPTWNGYRGAVTWASGTAGVRGVVSESNSLVGSSPADQVGSNGIITLSNGNYVVRSPQWNGYRGAVTWGSGTGGVSGVVSEANSLVGSSPGDQVGALPVTTLGSGNYVILTPTWNGNRGAVTWGSSTTGVSGVVSEANSLVGSSPGDQVGATPITVLSSGNYVIRSPQWNANRGAVTWGSGTAGVRGVLSEANSLVGTDPADQVGSRGITTLSNGNYVAVSPTWNGNRGAVTWGSGTAGVLGPVSAANSLVGTDPADQVGSRGITTLSNGNYVVLSRYWNGNRGAATWGDGTTGVHGVVSEANSLVGSDPNDGVGDFVTALSNCNYVVRSRYWNGNRGEVTWGDGTTGVHGVVSEANSLVGSYPGDQVSSSVASLSNGNYVVGSQYWNGNRGAATWGSGTAGVSGIVSEANSLVGSNPGDQVSSVGFDSLSNGNYVLRSPLWNDRRGAMTWFSGTAGVTGVLSETNSLVGSTPGDGLGNTILGALISLGNGNYLIPNPNWNSNRGSLTWFSATAGVQGVVSESNSLVGSSPGDRVGTAGSVAVLSSGNYVILISSWNGYRGAATWGSGTTGVSGVVSAANSLVGSNPGDLVGYAGTRLSNGNYLIVSPFWNGNRGAITWGSGTAGVRGVLSDANSLVGDSPNDFVGSVDASGHSDLVILSSGNYLVHSPLWHGHRGAVTWVNSATGQTLDGHGTVTPQNSVIGSAANAGLGFVVENNVTRTFLVPFSSDGGGRVTATFVDPNRLTYALGQGQTVTITPDFLTRTLNAGTAVVLQASNDLTVNDPITVRAGGRGGSLTLQAGRSIVLNASISTDNGALTLIANDTAANGVVDADRDPGSAVIATADGVILNTGTGALTVELRDGAGLTNTDSGAITLQTVTAGSVSVVNNGPSSGSDVVLGSVTTAGPQSYANPNGTTVVTGNLTASDSPLTFTDAVLLSHGLTLDAGSGSVLFEGSATVAPGVLTVAGSMTLSASATFAVTLNGTDPDSYSSVHASGPLDLGGSTLSLTLGYTPAVGDSFTLLSTDDGSPVTGTFAGLDEGAVFSQNGLTFQITYRGGPRGNSVVLTRLT